MNDKAWIAVGVLGGGALLFYVANRSKASAQAGGLGGLVGGSDSADGMFGLAKLRAAASGEDATQADRDALKRARAQAGLHGAFAAGTAFLGSWMAA